MVFVNEATWGCCTYVYKNVLIWRVLKSSLWACQHFKWRLNIVHSVLSLATGLSGFQSAVSCLIGMCNPHRRWERSQMSISSSLWKKMCLVQNFFHLLGFLGFFKTSSTSSGWTLWSLWYCSPAFPVPLWWQMWHTMTKITTARETKRISDKPRLPFT